MYIADQELCACLGDLIRISGESTGNTQAFILLYVVLNPEVQKKIHEELDAVLGNQSPKLDDRNRLMNYLIIIFWGFWFKVSTILLYFFIFLKISIHRCSYSGNHKNQFHCPSFSCPYGFRNNWFLWFHISQGKLKVMMLQIIAGWDDSSIFSPYRIPSYNFPSAKCWWIRKSSKNLINSNQNDSLTPR